MVAEIEGGIRREKTRTLLEARSQKGTGFAHRQTPKCHLVMFLWHHRQGLGGRPGTAARSRGAEHARRGTDTQPQLQHGG